MPAIAPLWALVFNLEVASTIRIMTLLFVPSLIVALGGKSAQDIIEEEEDDLNSPLVAREWIDDESE